MIRVLAVAAFSLAVVCEAQTAQPPVVTPTTPTWQPMTGKERLDRYWKESFGSPGLYFASTGAAIGSQFRNDPTEWGKTGSGYAKRAASNFVRFSAQTAIHEAGAAALGLDPRYHSCECKGFLPRAGHAVKWTLVTRDNNGHIRPNVPVVAAAYGSGMISTLWYPDRYTPLTDGVRVGHQQLGMEFGINVIREFGPELKRTLRRITPPFLRR